MRRLCNAALLSVLLVAGCARVPATPEKISVFRDTRVTLKWNHQRGRLYHVQCTAAPRKPGEKPVLVVNQTGWNEGQLTIERGLEFDRPYQFNVWDQATPGVLVSTEKFIIQFEQAEAYAPGEQQLVKNLRPRFQWKPAEYAHVRYKLLLGDEPTLTNPREILVDASATERHPGPDNLLNTDDDVAYVQWTPSKDLETSKTHYWAVVTLYYHPEDFANGKTPAPKDAFGTISSDLRRFSVPAQTQMIESLAGVTRITDRRANVDALWPAISKDYSVAYTHVDAGDVRTIHVVRGRMRDSSPVFDRGDELFTQAIRGSQDFAPAWDPAGDSVYFTSTRAHIPAIWRKGRTGRGYELLSNHDRPVMNASVSGDGKTIVYQLAQVSADALQKVPAQKRRRNDLWNVWKMDVDGRSPTDLGYGFEPQVSHGGKHIAFVRSDPLGCDQVVVMDLETGGLTFLTNEGRNYDPHWSPDDQRIVFVSERDLPGATCIDADRRTNPNRDVWIMNSDGSRPTRMTDFIGDDIHPMFTPDGNHIIFASTRDNKDQFGLWMGRLSSAAPKATPVARPASSGSMTQPLPAKPAADPSR